MPQVYSLMTYKESPLLTTTQAKKNKFACHTDPSICPIPMSMFSSLKGNYYPSFTVITSLCFFIALLPKCASLDSYSYSLI